MRVSDVSYSFGELDFTNTIGSLVQTSCCDGYVGCFKTTSSSCNTDSASANAHWENTAYLGKINKRRQQCYTTRRSCWVWSLHQVVARKFLTSSQKKLRASRAFDYKSTTVNADITRALKAKTQRGLYPLVLKQLWITCASASVLARDILP